MPDNRQSNLLQDVFTFSLLVLLLLMPPAAIRNLIEHPQLTFLWIALYFIFFAVTIGGAFKLYRRLRPLPKLKHAIGADSLAIIGGYVAILVGEMVLLNLNRLLYHQVQTANNQAILNSMHSSTLVGSLIIFSAVFLSPVAEELVFRGVWMNLFFSSQSFWLPILSSGLLFTLVHASNTPVSYILYFYMGCVLAFVYQKTGKLSNSIGIHLINNLVSSILLIMPLIQ